MVALFVALPGVRLILGDTDAEGDSDGDTDGDGDGEAATLGVTGDLVVEAVPEGVTLNDTVREGVLLGETDTVALSLLAALPGVRLLLGDSDAVGDSDGDTDGDGDGEAATLGETGDFVGDDTVESDALSVNDSVGEGLTEIDIATLPLLLSLLEALPGVTLPLGDTDGEAGDVDGELASDGVIVLLNGEGERPCGVTQLTDLIRPL